MILKKLLESVAKHEAFSISTSQRRPSGDREYIAEHDELAADRYTDQLQERACELLLFPELGRMREEIHSGVRSLLSRNHLIFYRIQCDGVQILRIIHGSMDLPKQEYPRI